jgi:hypothetical protein
MQETYASKMLPKQACSMATKVLSIVTPQIYNNCISSDLDAEDKEQQKALEETYKPLLDWLKVQAKDIVRDGTLSMFQDVQLVDTL